MYFKDDEEDEQIETTMYEQLPNNIPTTTLTIDVNIVVKDLFKYIKLKCTQRVRIMDIIALSLSIFSIILAILLTVIDKDKDHVNANLVDLLFIVRIVKDITVILLLCCAFLMIGYEFNYCFKQRNKFKLFHDQNPEITPEEIVGSLMDINNIFNFKNWNELAMHVKYYRKCKSFKSYAILIAVLSYYQLPINKWNLMYLNESINYLHKKHFYHFLRLITFIIVVFIAIILISIYPGIFLS